MDWDERDMMKTRVDEAEELVREAYDEIHGLAAKRRLYASQDEVKAWTAQFDEAQEKYVKLRLELEKFGIEFNKEEKQSK